MSHFTFLQAEWPALYDAARRAERLAHADARASCFYTRRCLELSVAWIYKHDPALRLPYQDNLSALIHEPTFKTTAGEAVFSKARLITRLGNEAVHSQRPIQQVDAVTALRELFHVSYWLARTYARTAKPAASLAFDPEALPRPQPAAAKQSPDQLRQLEATTLKRQNRHRVLGPALLTPIVDARQSIDEAFDRHQHGI